MNDMVSVIVPVFNSEKTIRRCIDSLLKQTYENIEIILVDDGSNDNSLQHCLDYKETSLRNIKVFSKPNGGVSSARNKGINEAEGKYIQFVDADDFVSKNYTELLVKSMHNNQWVLCGYEEITEKKVGNVAPLLPNRYSKKDFLESIFHWIYPENFLFTPWNKIYLREIIITNEILFNADYRVGEDAIFNLEYLNKINSIQVINECLYYYDTTNEMSAMKKIKADWYKANFVITKELRHVISEADLTIEKMEKYADYQNHLTMLYFTRMLTFQKEGNVVAHCLFLLKLLRGYKEWQITEPGPQKRVVKQLVYLTEAHFYYLALLEVLFLRMGLKIRNKIKGGSS